MNKIDIRLTILEMLTREHEILNIKQLLDNAEALEQWVYRCTNINDYDLN